MIGSGRLRAFTAKIRPFRDRPDVELDWLFYAVPWTNPAGPVTPFVDRFWDNREHWFPPGIGINPTSMKPYFGPIPGPEVGPLEGTEDEWLNGLSYEKWIAGEYVGATCWPLKPIVRLFKLKQTQRLYVTVPKRLAMFQEQSLSVRRVDALLRLRQSHNLTAPRVRPVVMRQAQELRTVRVDALLRLAQSLDLAVVPVTPLSLSQEHSITVLRGLLLGQSQGIGLLPSNTIYLRQSQDMPSSPATTLELKQSQDMPPTDALSLDLSQAENINPT